LVLSSAIIAPKTSKELAGILKIDLDAKNFFNEKQPNVGVLETSREGIFICGCAQGPKDIPDSVSQASGAAGLAGKWIKDDRREEIKEDTTPIDASGEPRVGVFICHCGKNIGGIVDVPDVVEYVKDLPNVVFAEDNLYTCSEDAQKKIQDAILEHKLNRVVVASCSPRTHEPIFRDTINDVGLNPYLFDMANIRDQRSWVHMHEPEKATLKSKELVKSAVARSTLLEPLIIDEIDIEQSTLVIGGGISGITTALALDAQGFDVHLIEKAQQIGGRLAGLGLLAPQYIPSSEILYEKYRLLNNSKINLITNSNIKNINGFIGNFKVEIDERKTGVDISKCDLCGICADKCPISVPDEKGIALKRNKKAISYMENGWPQSYAIDFAACNKCGECVKICPNNAIDLDDTIVNHNLDIGTIIIAIGSDLYRPKQGEFGYGDIPNVITNLDLETLMDEREEGKPLVWNGKEVKKIALIHCVGSRDPEDFTGCSRYCCYVALKQADELRRSGLEVVDYYRDIRAYGKDAERIYNQVRMKGVVFFRFTPESKPKVFQKDGVTKIMSFDNLIDQNVELAFDLVVLSTGMRPREAETKELQEMLKIPRGANGFFLERHPKLGPVETNTDGIYLCGCAQYPKNIPESVAQALGAAAKAAIPMAKKKIRGEGIPSVVNKDICSSCGTCIVVCPYGAISKDEDGKAFVNPTLCKGCGICRATCPEKAILAPHFTRSELLAQIDALSEGILE
jgi:heterodisulfide reductase subunit A